MNQKQPFIINVLNQAATFSGRGSIIVLQYADEDAARNVARKIAQETGRIVTVRGKDMRLIDTIPAVTVH